MPRSRNPRRGVPLSKGIQALGPVARPVSASAPRKPNEPRDASAAAITASALIQLSDYAGEAYLHQAIGIMNSLSSASYLAKAGENHNFLLKHSTGSIPHGVEIDVPINYADYYFLEALVRLNDRGIALKTDVTSVKN